MLRLALKTALAKKIRLVSTSLAVMLGVAFLSGTMVFTDTIQRTFDDLFADIYDETDGWVRSTHEVESPTGFDQRGRIPESILDDVAAVDGVADAQGAVSSFAQLVDSDGDAIGDPGRGAPTFGMSYISGPLSPWQLTEGSRPPGPGELVIDKGSADRGDLNIGDTVTVLTQTGPHHLALVGTARFGSVDSPGGASISIFDLRTAQEDLLGGTGEFDAIWVDAEPGLSETVLAERIEPVLPDGVEALTGTEITEETQDSMHEGLGFLSTFLLVFAVIGLVVACFTIYNTFQIIVTQRTREMAMLRAVGATRRQVVAAQLVEAVVVGALASVVGLGAGVLVARGLRGFMAALDMDVPGGAMVFAPRTALVGVVVGLGATVASAVFPSLRASRIAPLAALRSVSSPGTDLTRRRLVNGLAVTAVGIAALVVGLGGSGIELVGLGAFLIFLGAFVLGPMIARPVVRVVAAPLPAVSGVVGELARENAARNPKRTARTGGALMVGVALVTAITVIAASARDWTRDIFEDAFTGDFVVSTTTFGFGGLSSELADGLADLPEVDAATGVRVGAARVTTDDGSGDEAYVAVDPATVSQVFDIGVVEGAVENLTTGGVFLDDGEAADRGLAVGDTLEFQFVNGESRRLTVEGIYTDEELAGTFVVSHALHESTGLDQFDFSVYVATADGVSDADAMAAVERVTDVYANADLQSRSEYIEAQAAQIDQLINLMYGLLGLAVFIALLSIANSMVLSVHERTHELGLLRAVGMTRGQTRTLVRWEAVLIAILGTGLGVVIGVFLGWSISVTIRDGGLATFALPVGAIAVVAALAVIGGVLAALRPAIRAARLNVLRAIATE